jgi:hypothetical protein
LPESVQVVGEAEGSMTKGATEVRDSDAHDEASVVEREPRFTLGEKAIVKVDEG